MSDLDRQLTRLPEFTDGKNAVKHFMSLAGTQETRALEGFAGTVPMLQKGHSGQVNDVAVSADFKYIYSAADDDTVKKWDFSSGYLIRTFKGHRGDVNSVAISSCDRLIATGSDDGTVRIWNTLGDVIRVFEGHREEVQSVAFTPDSRYVVSGGSGGDVRLWPTESADNRPTVLRGHTRWVSRVAVSPDGRSVISASWDQTVKIWDLDGNLVRTLDHSRPEVKRAFGETLMSSIWSLSISPDGSLIATGLYSGVVAIWTFAGDLVRTLKVDRSERVDSLAFDNQGRFLATGAVGRGSPTGRSVEGIKIWRIDNWTMEAVLGGPDGHQDTIRGLVFRDNVVVSCGWDGAVKIWDLSITPYRSRNCITYTKHIESVALSHDGRTLAVVVGDTVRTFGLSGNAIFVRHESKTLTACAFSQDDGILAVGSWDHSIELYTSDGLILGSCVGHTERVIDVAFSYDGRIFASASGQYRDRGEVFVWRVGKHHTYLPVRDHRSNVDSVLFDPTDRFLISKASDDTIKIWNNRGYTLHAEIRFRSGWERNLSISPSGEFLCAGGRSAYLCVSDGGIPAHSEGGGSPLRFDTQHIGEVFSWAVSRDGNLIATGGERERERSRLRPRWRASEEIGRADWKCSWSIVCTRQ